MSPGVSVYLVKFLPQALEEPECGLCHLLEHVVLSVLRGHFSSARSMVKDKCLEIRLGTLVHKAVFRKE